MADKNIGSLPAITELSDDALLVAEQQSAAGKITGKQIKDFAKAGVEAYVSYARQAASDAESSAAEAADAVTQAGSSVSAAQAAQQAAESAEDGAEAARTAIESMIVEAISLAAGQPASVTKSLVDGVVKLVFGLPKGAAGDTGPAGSSIQSITRTAGTGAPGTTDTYTITLTDGSTGGTFRVYNGQDGTGSGDMAKAVYDPQNKAQDIFAYADAAAAQAAEKEIFVATYGTTTFAEIGAAFQAGCALFCRNQNNTVLAPLHSRSMPSFVFSHISSDLTRVLYTCTADGWSEETVRLLPAAGATMGGNLDMAGWDVDKIGALGLGDPDAGVSIYEEGTAEAPVVGFYGNNADEPVILANIAAPTGSSHGANKGYVDQALAGKQDKLTGTQGQVVGFDASGAAVAQAAPSGGDRNWYGVCSTASSTAAKTVNVGDGFVLETGVRVTVKFLETNNATGPSLNVNGTGAKGITLYGSVYSSEYDWIRGAVETLVYDGTYWVLEGAAPSTLVYRGRTKLQSVPNTSETVAATPNCVLTALNRTNSVNLANTAYTTYMARGEALFATETTPTVNGAIAWQYE